MCAVDSRWELGRAVGTSEISSPLPLPLPARRLTRSQKVKKGGNTCARVFPTATTTSVAFSFRIHKGRPRVGPCQSPTGISHIISVRR